MKVSYDHNNVQSTMVLEAGKFVARLLHKKYSPGGTRSVPKMKLSFIAIEFSLTGISLVGERLDSMVLSENMSLPRASTSVTQTFWLATGIFFTLEYSFKEKCL